MLRHAAGATYSEGGASVVFPEFDKPVSQRLSSTCVPWSEWSVYDAKPTVKRRKRGGAGDHACVKGTSLGAQEEFVHTDSNRRFLKLTVSLKS